MRKKFLSLFILILLAGAFLPAGLAAEAPAAGPPWYVRGAFNGWGTDLMYDDGTHGDAGAGDGIFTTVITVTTAGRYEFKVDDGNWTDPYPPSNAWIDTGADNTPVKFTFDTNTYADGWFPTHNIVNAQDGLTAWTAVGDWQGWSNNSPATAMVSLGSGLYAYTTAIPTAGTHQFKACRTGAWDAVGPDGASGGRSINTANLDFTTTVANQLVRFLLDANTGRIQVQFPTDTVLINELDADQVSTDSAEFIEFYDGGAGNTSLDGLVIVFYNGSNDLSYRVFDLDGRTTNAQGYFVLCGNAANVPNCDWDVTPDTDLIQNGQDAAALYAGDAVQFPNNTPVTTTNVIDAIVYDTSDPDDPGLLVLLNPGQPQVDENSRGSGVTDSNQRCPNGAGGLRNTETYTQTPPTAGLANDCGAPPTPDAAVTKSGPAYVGATGGNIDYTLTYEMVTAADGQNIVITDTLPAGVTYVTFTSILPVTLTSSSPVVFDAGSLAGLGSNVITLTANVPALPFGTHLTNTVEIACDDDGNPANDEDEWVTLVVGSETGIAKAGPGFVLPGQSIAYTLTYTVGGDPAQGVVITDTLPAAVTYVSDNAPVTPTEPTPGTWVWALGAVNPGTHSFVVQGLVSSNPMTWTLHNEAWVAATNDTDPNNNYDFADTTLPMPISELQYTTEPGDGTYPSPYVGQMVWTIGVVVAGTGNYGSAGTRYFIEDPAGGPWNGLLVYNGGTHPDVVEGDLVLLYGLVNEYSGATQVMINAGSGGSQQVLAAGQPLPLDLVPTSELTSTGGLVPESWESNLIAIECAEVTSGFDPDTIFTVTDGSGGAARVGNWAGYSYVPQVGDALGLLSGIFMYETFGVEEYRLEPRSDDDIVPGLAAVSLGPVDGAVDVPVNAVITATFSMSLNPSTVTTATFYLEGPAGLVPGVVSYDAGTWTATFTPDAELAYGTIYTATLTTGIQSLDGAALCADYSWTFSTVEEPGPDLRESSKLANVSQVPAGGVFTYTIRLLNTGELTASAVLTDVVPAEVTVLTPTLPPGMVYVGGELLWSGEVYPNQAPTLLPFQVQVNPDVPAGTTIVNVVWIDDGVHLFTRTVSVQVTGAPDIDVTPLALNVVLAPDQSADRDLTIANVGEAELIWAVSEPAAWLSASPTFGQVPAGGQSTVVVTFNATGVPVGTYTTTLDVNSTDPDEPHVYVDVTLVVTTGCIPVSDPAFSWLPANPVVGQAVTFNGSANGSDPITYVWALGDGGTGAGATVQHTYALSNTYTVVMTATNACGDVSISHSVVVTGEPAQVWKVYLPVVMRSGGR